MTDYYLHVDLLVQNVDAFERATGEFLALNAFRRFAPDFNYTLTLALKSRDPVPYGKADSSNRSREDGAYRYVHLWRVPNTTDLDLAAVMTRAADDELYRRIDGLVLSEAQDFVAYARGTNGIVSAPARGQRFIRVQRQFTSAQITAYLFELGLVTPILRAIQQELPGRDVLSWHSLGAFQNVTGSLNRVTEFWQTDADERVDSFNISLSALGDDFLNRVPALRSKPVDDVRESFVIPEYFQARLRG